MTDKQPKLAELAKEVPAPEAWRVFGIMAELVEATERLVGIHPAVSVFGSARVKPGTPYYELAEETARLLSDAGFAVVCGGGPGLMEATNRGAFKGGGLAVGLNIDLPLEQPSSRYQHISLRFKHFFTRKAMFAKVATAFIVLPGGYGTLEEMFEMVTWLQLQLQAKPVGIVNVEGYFDSLLAFIQHGAGEGFIRREHWDLLIVEHAPALLFERLQLHAATMKRSHPPSVDLARG